MPDAIGARHITISTVGVAQAITRLAARQLQSTLAVSIHAPTQVRPPLAERAVDVCGGARQGGLQRGPNLDLLSQ